MIPTPHRVEKHGLWRPLVGITFLRLKSECDEGMFVWRGNHPPSHDLLPFIKVKKEAKSPGSPGLSSIGRPLAKIRGAGAQLCTHTHSHNYTKLVKTCSIIIAGGEMRK